MDSSKEQVEDDKKRHRLPIAVKSTINSPSKLKLKPRALVHSLREGGMQLNLDDEKRVKHEQRRLLKYV
jgi:hypothetical protein